jgi:hypothetical protein
VSRVLCVVVVRQIQNCVDAALVQKEFGDVVVFVSMAVIVGKLGNYTVHGFQTSKRE